MSEIVSIGQSKEEPQSLEETISITNIAASKVNEIRDAEGIENDRQLQMLKGLGCQLGQGFYWSKALPASCPAPLR